MEELFVMICVVSGDMMGEAWTELEVAIDEALMAEAGTEGVEDIGGRKEVCTWLGLPRLDFECCRDCGFGWFIIVDDAVAGSEGEFILQARLALCAIEGDPIT